VDSCPAARTQAPRLFLAIVLTQLLGFAGCGGGGTSVDTSAVASAQTTNSNQAAAAHYARLNEIRSQMRLGPLQWQAVLAAAAQAHAEYRTANQVAGHEEDPALPGFTGESITDRVQAAGYKGQLSQEVMTGGASTTWEQGRARMDDLLLAPLHRLQLIAPEFDEVGVGVSPAGGPLVTDLGASGARPRTADSRWMYPYNGQAGVTPAFATGVEVGLPAALPATTGTPLTLSGHLFSMVTYSSSVLQEEQGGQQVELLALSVPGEVRAALIFFPTTALRPATHYVWTINATVDGLAATTISRFLTAP
jgi:hypothetical protein